ncbi:DNA polymerase I [Myxococcota bacterium]|nr:DNA polymerase I [Myxococcota bacterium]
MTKLLHIIDGSGYIFRAYYAIRALSTGGGEPTNAVYGFTTMIEKALREEQPKYIAITFDTGHPTFRRELYGDYKANRSAPPEDLPRQIPRIHQVTDGFRLKKFMVSGFEADDVIATLTRRALEEGFDVRIITGDKDLMQLVGDRVQLWEPMKGQRFDEKEVVEKWGVKPTMLRDLLALCGDSSDNIPGVPGIGPKTAAKLLADHGDLEGVLKAAADGKIKGKNGQSLVDKAADARLSQKLVQLDDHVPLEVGLEDLRYPGPDRAALKKLFIELEFRRLIPQVEDVAAQVAAAAVAEGRPVPQDSVDEPAANEEDAEPAPVDEGERPSKTRAGVALGSKIDRALYSVITTSAELHELVRTLAIAPRVALAVETSTPRTVDADVLGLAFAWERNKAAYVPIAHRYIGCPKQLAMDEVLAALRPVLEDGAVPKVSVELKACVELFERFGVSVQGLAFDSTIASFLLEPDEVTHGAVSVARRFLAHEALEKQQLLSHEKVKISFDQVAVEAAAGYVAEKAEIAWRAVDAMRAELEEADVSNVLSDVELPLVPVLGRMELAGVRIDVSQLDEMSAHFAIELERLEKACYEAAGKEFNIGSPKQLQKILFEELELKVVKRTKTGPSTDASVLEVLADSHPLPQAILDHRQVQKLKSTYVDALPKMVSEKTGRVHTTFSQSNAATGRLSSTDPNLQNIPIRSETGRKLRKVFVADPGNLLISVDYSQVELRVLAHFSEDEILMDAFTRGIDVHTRTAAALFQIDPAEVNREQRTQAKAVNFGVLYGMGPVRLARDLKIPRRTASKFVDDYFERQKGVKKYIEDTLEFARKHGYVRTLLGRRRLLADINSANRGARAAAERVAINTPIQGSAADLIKLAMIRLDARLREEQVPARLLLQVHDELLVETNAADVERVAALVKRDMENVYPLKVPLLAEAHWGPTWDEAH